MTISVDVCGVNFRYVRQLPVEVFNLVCQAVTSFEAMRGEWNEFQEVNNLLGDPFASGHFGNVYALSDDYILKIEKPMHKGSYNTRDGKILEDLQGIAMIPQIYMYDDNNDYMVIQRIKGQTCGGYQRDPEFDLPKDFDLEWTKAMIKNTAQEIEARGWRIADAHAGNCMIDHEGNFWIVDVGLFDSLKELEEGKRPFGRSTLEAIRSLGCVYQGMKRKQSREKAQMEAQVMKQQIEEVVERDVQRLGKAFAQVGKALVEIDFNVFARNMAQALKDQANNPHKPVTIVTPRVRTKGTVNPLYNYGRCSDCWNAVYECTCYKIGYRSYREYSSFSIWS
jgi:hypothetical protein